MIVNPIVNLTGTASHTKYDQNRLIAEDGKVYNLAELLLALTTGKSGGDYYQVGHRSDIATLPTTQSTPSCNMYSQCLCEEDWSVWVLSADGTTWKEVTII